MYVELWKIRIFYLFVVIKNEFLFLKNIVYKLLNICE